jgi:hypothetical protein
MHLPMNLRTYFFCRLFLLFCVLPGAQAGLFAQADTADSLFASLQRYQAAHLTEKVFVHTDKGFYVPGEIIWFKIYDMDGFFHRPLDISKVAYVEILTTDQRPVLQAKVAMQDGCGRGSLLVPFTLNTGTYLLRAYTSWMKNFPPEYFFEKRLRIVNLQKRPAPMDAGRDTAFDLQFFPEGGNLVNGIRSEIGFRLAGPDGKGLAASGIILGPQGDTLARTSTFKFGLGHFFISPARGDRYRALFRTGDNRLIQVDLPQAQESGYVMHLEKKDSTHLSVTVMTRGLDNHQPVWLVAHTRGLLKSSGMRVLEEGRTEFLLDPRVLGDGVSVFTLFDQHRQPVCERLYFRQPPPSLALDMRTEKDQYERRERVYLRIGALDSIHDPLHANLSVSVFLTDSLQTPDVDNIFSWLWLASDLRGSIESPSYYFQTGAEADEAADNLMLTHGWRRFQWNEVMAWKGQLPEFLPEYDGHLVNGRVVDRRTGSPSSHVSTYLSVPGKEFAFSMSQSNESGHVRFDVPRYYGNSEMILQTSTGADSLLRIEIANPFSEKYTKEVLPPLQLPEQWSNQLVFHSRHAQVHNDFVVDRREPFLSPVFADSTPFYGVPDNKYFLDEYTRFITMEEVMREYVTEVHVRKQKDRFHIDVQNIPYHMFFDSDPLVLLDGLPVFDMNKLMAIDPLKVKKIEIVARKYSIDSAVHLGIISCFSYDGNLAGLPLDPNALVVEYPGMQLQREFFSPVYDISSDSQRRVPDFRNVLCWSPDVRLDSSGRSTVEFFTSDLPGNYIALIQGITPDGAAGAWCRFTVRK